MRGLAPNAQYEKTPPIRRQLLLRRYQNQLLLSTNDAVQIHRILGSKNLASIKTAPCRRTFAFVPLEAPSREDSRSVGPGRRVGVARIWVIANPRHPVWLCTAQEVSRRQVTVPER